MICMTLSKILCQEAAKDALFMPNYVKEKQQQRNYQQLT